jgi:ketosteroid isomerase-like protein
MKNSPLLALAGLAISFAVPAFAQQTNTPDPELRQRLVALIKIHNQALDKNDAAAVAAQFTEDAILVPETGPVKGRQAIQKYYEDLFKDVRFSNDLGSVDEDSPHIIGTAGNELWATGAWTATFQGKGWGPMDFKGYWTVIREGDDWKIRMLSFNTTPAPAATPSPTATPTNK